MAFQLFKKHCPICGMQVDKDKAIVRFSKHFCSDKCAEEYREKLAVAEKKAAKGGGCCG